MVTGFLGSGKTTVIANTIEELQAIGERVLYIKNEIGSENIDAQILKGKHIETRELANGCICCTLVGPFVDSINEALQAYQPSRIIIEASGAADPSAIALMITGHPKLRRDAVITVIDVCNFTGYIDLSETARHQAAFTDLLIFNKVESATLEQKQRVVGYVRELNTTSPIIEAPNGHVPAWVLCGPPAASGTTPQGIAQAKHEAEAELDHDHATAHNHLEIDGLGAKTITVTHILPITKLQQWLEQLPKQVVRVKGWVETTAGWQLVQKVGNRSELTPCSKQAASKLVCIGFMLDQLSFPEI